MIRKLCALGAAVPIPCAVGLICGPIPLFMGTVIVPRVIRYFGESKKEKINFGISDTKLKIIIDKIDSDVVNDSEKMKQALYEIERSISYWKKSKLIEKIEIICVLPETKVGKSAQLEVLFFSQKLAETLQSKIKIIEKQFFYDIQPEISENEVEEKMKEKLKTEIGLNCKIVISPDGKIKFM